jgi:hypothetical protein
VFAAQKEDSSHHAILRRLKEILLGLAEEFVNRPIELLAVCGAVLGAFAVRAPLGSLREHMRHELSKLSEILPLKVSDPLEIARSAKELKCTPGENMLKSGNR